MSNIEFHRLEDWDRTRTDKDAVICSFETERFGYLQVEMTRYDGTVKFRSAPQEPDLNMFSKQDRLKMEQKTFIVLRMVYDAPAAKDRFEP